MTTLINNEEFNKKKVIFIMGVTGTGKSRLSVDVATHLRGEIINSDKMQVYKGLEIVTNKITHTEIQGVRHYLLVEIEPNSDFTADDFCLQAVVYIEKILKTQRVPIIVGGSNSYIEKLVEDPVFMFKYKYDSCFIWIDVEQSVLNRRVDMRVDQMVKAGLVDEVRLIFIPDADYTKGIRRSIGLPEMDRYLREETNMDGDDESKQMILQASISSIKRNSRMLICNQLDKIQRLISEKMWPLHHIIATDVFKEDREEDIHEAWTNTVLQPCLDIVKRFLKRDRHNIIIEGT
ncbi:adenylate isopentenyltransferase 5, chloroplastic-like [Solanum pennellii]|uniref:Adenylate isopentenyltransferase 5, chloroplastic-like n=1 Tax=Solanum pennellii TaxID=28526 RepID=A0ABM1FJ84_SOLPN|nr:adenylate isopentenyltransferase 5, chloroplastic-like [Solanum pennellii]